VGQLGGINGNRRQRWNGYITGVGGLQPGPHTDAVAKLLIEKGVFTQEEFIEKIKAERATYQAMFRQKGN